MIDHIVSHQFNDDNKLESLHERSKKIVALYGHTGIKMYKNKLSKILKKHGYGYRRVRLDWKTKNSGNKE